MNMEVRQLEFNFTPAARRTDPITSKLADRRITQSGGKQTQAMRILCAVKKHPGKTSHELASLTGLDRHQVARRLPDLETNGFVVRGPARSCAIAGTLAVTWNARTDDGSGMTQEVLA